MAEIIEQYSGDARRAAESAIGDAEHMRIMLREYTVEIDGTKSMRDIVLYTGKRFSMERFLRQQEVPDATTD